MNKFDCGKKYFSCLVIGLSMLTLFSVSCGSSKKEHSPQIKFTLVDSLLAPAYDVPKTGKSLRTPIGFIEMPEAPLKAFQAQVRQMVGDSEGIELQQFYSDSLRGSWLMICSVRGINLSSDTANFVGKYRAALQAGYGNANVKTEDYWIGDIFAKTFLVTDSLYMKHQLICLSPAKDGLELEYVIPRQLYPEMASLIESSIASIRLKK
jgi:hypothetical protein